MFNDGRLKLLGLILLAATSWLALQFLAEDKKRQAAIPFAGGIDYYLNGATIQQFDHLGLTSYRLKAAKAEHYQDNNRVELHDVNIDYRENKLNQTIGWDLNAGHGTLTQQTNQALTLDNWVTIKQVNVPQPVTLTTERLTLNNQNKTIRSQHPVIVTQAGNRVTADSMAVNLITNAVSLMGKVKAHYAGEHHANNAESP